MTAINTKNWRGTYVARLTTNDRGTLDREWAEVTQRASKGSPVRVYGDLEAGWYEVREGYRTYHGELTPKVYYRVTELTVEKVTFEHMASGIDGPTPGELGEYGTDYCACGEDVSTFDADGFPRCDNHTVPTGADVAGLAVPA